MIIKTYIQTADYYKTITTIVRRRDDRDTMASKSSKDTWSKKCGGEYNRITDIMHRSKSEKRKLIKAKRILNNLFVRVVGRNQIVGAVDVIAVVSGIPCKNN